MKAFRLSVRCFKRRWHDACITLAIAVRKTRPYRPQASLRLAGHASTRTFGLLLHRLGLGKLDLRRVGHHLEHGVREPFPRQEEEPEADTHGGLDRLQSDPVGDAARRGDSVV